MVRIWRDFWYLTAAFMCFRSFLRSIGAYYNIIMLFLSNVEVS